MISTMKKQKTTCFYLTLLLGFLLLSSCERKEKFPSHNLEFKGLATTWDEAIPLGNGILGVLIWQKDGKLRFSLDRADLWDLRPMARMNFDKWKFKDVYQHWNNGTYDEVYKELDSPSKLYPAPSKIPAAALGFNIEALGKVKSVELDLDGAVCIVIWENGTKLSTFVHAYKPVGWYKFENLSASIDIELIPPAYNRPGDGVSVNQSGSDLDRLGYSQGKTEKKGNTLIYNQEGWDGFSYQVYSGWEEEGTSLTGCWSVSSANKTWDVSPLASENVTEALRGGLDSNFGSHLAWWEKYWDKSSVSIPDTVLQKQYELEMYKFGSIARANTPPISLQAVWTADNGKLPPWRGDFHHDLNTQLSYWPAYAGNQLDLEEGFINWLWKYRPAFSKYTKDYFETDGLNVPGVTTLEGEPIGGWIQYSLGQTVSAWLAHHFYLHWKFTMDRDFLKEKAYPWLKETAVFLDHISVRDDQGNRKLKISSSPEIYNNSKEAWFSETTNFDLALIRWDYEKAAELADELGLADEAARWRQILSEWPGYSVDDCGLMFAPGFPYNESHRHFSHLMAFHPLGLIDFSNGQPDRDIIQKTLFNLEHNGPDRWTGYSYSWLGNLYARAFEGEKAAGALKTFAQCFCLKNSFHVNGDQTKSGKSKYTYRPFTLEGNFAFASGVQEMLLQSHSGTIEVFPAIPAQWANVGFEKLRAQGAFIVSAQRENGKNRLVEIIAEKGGTCKLKNPFGKNTCSIKASWEGQMDCNGEVIEINFPVNGKAILKME